MKEKRGRGESLAMLISRRVSTLRGNVPQGSRQVNKAVCGKGRAGARQGERDENGERRPAKGVSQA